MQKNRKQRQNREQKKEQNRGQNRRKIKGTDGMFGIVFAVCLVFFMVLNLLTPSEEESREEGRRLEGKPRFSWEGIATGDYMEQYEAYLLDQFAGRGLLRDIRISLNRLGGSREENGVLIGKNGQLMEKIATPKQDVLSDNLEAVKQFAEKNADIPIHMILVPDAANILSDELPFLADVPDQNRMFTQVKRELQESVDWIDAQSALNKHTDEKLYYETDPHWTTTGAFYVFGAAAEKLGISDDYASSFAIYPVTETFNGELAKRSGCESNKKELIEIYAPQDGDTDVVISYVDEQRKTTSLYDSSKLKSANQYEVFFGGDTSVMDIRTVSVSERRLLVIKDSFANSFLPFLTPYFREIVVVDPKYYSGTMDDIMETYRITDALILYGGNSFFQDNNISGVLGSGESN